jgi:hypothetical protein
VPRSFYETVGDPKGNIVFVGDQLGVWMARSARVRVIPDSANGDAFDGVEEFELSPFKPLLDEPRKANGSSELDGERKLALRIPLRHGSFWCVLFLCNELERVERFESRFKTKLFSFFLETAQTAPTAIFPKSDRFRVRGKK